MEDLEQVGDHSAELTTSSLRRKRLFFLSFSLVLILGIGFYLLTHSSPGGIFHNTTAIITQAFKNVLGGNSQKEKVFEIDLSSSTENPQKLGKQPDKIREIPATAPSSVSAKEEKGLAGEESGKISQIALNNKGASAALEVASSSASSSSEETAPQSVQDKVATTPDCTFSSASAPSHQVIFNEIAWMGSPARSGETTTTASGREWIELKNLSHASVDLSGWQILDESERFNVVFDKTKIADSGFYLLERKYDDAVPGIPADKIYNGALSNSGMWLKMLDNNCSLADEVNASSSWPGGDNTTKKTLERNGGDFGWHTSADPGGTPKRENSKLAQVVVADPNAKYSLGVALQGDGSGAVYSAPLGISCGIDCSEEFPFGTLVTLTATSSPGSSFLGWSGACVGVSSCKLTVTSTVAVSASFKSLTPALNFSNGPPAGSVVPPPVPLPSPAASSSVNHLVISALQTTGGAGLTTNDFVKISNPLTAQFNLKGYRLVKRTKIGSSDTSLKSWTSDAFVPAGGYYLWANSSFTTISDTPDATTTGSIADDNGVAIRFGAEDTGTIVDSVAWGAAANAFVESAPYPANPTANQVLKRKFVKGVIQDTDNNSQDFHVE